MQKHQLLRKENQQLIKARHRRLNLQKRGEREPLLLMKSRESARTTDGLESLKRCIAFASVRMMKSPT
jgi:hypothetical protein